MIVEAYGKGGGGNKVWCCKYCHKKVTGSYSKVKGHLLKITCLGVEACKVMPDDVYRELKKEYDEAERQKAIFQQNEKQGKSYVTLPKGSDLVQHKKLKGSIEYSFNVLKREEADKECL